MDFSFPTLAGVSVLFFFVAILYSSVGHGGASGYLAVLSFFSIAPALMSSTALVLNVLVSTTAFFAFYRAGHFSIGLVWPFLVTSVPSAFVGGAVQLPTKAYFLLLAGVLLFAACRLIMEIRAGRDEAFARPPKLAVALPVGAGIGAVSGIVGVGGGIFLSPLILLKAWAGAKRTAAVSALFILVNSLAGLSGRLYTGTFALRELVPLLVAAFLGGIVGSRLGATRFSSLTLRRLLGVVLILASLKLVVSFL
ncbi:MAG: sulfite exporter TauE/SafE family protein [Bacteroidota bacterium]